MFYKPFKVYSALIFACLWQGFASSFAATSTHLPEAHALLHKAIVFYREAEDIQINFKAEVYTEATEKTDHFKGHLWLKDSVKFRLEMPALQCVSDGKTFWQYQPANKQVQIKKAQDIDGAALPGQVLFRFLDAEPLSVESVLEQGKSLLKLKLDPSKALKNTKSLMVFMRDDGSVEKIISEDLSENRSTYTLTSVKRNTGIKESIFSFTSPEGAEVVDMRD